MSLVKSIPSRRNGRGLLTQDPFFNLWDNNRRLMNFDRFFNILASDVDIPPINIKEEEKYYEVELAAPGFTKDQFEVELNQDFLTISVNRKEEKEQKEDNYISREFNYHAFSRSITIPENVDTKKEIKAHYENGVLKIQLNKKPNSSQKTKIVRVS